ncbi:hypothetical protein MN608_10293 [Microdochium nivale]|nr:hypothetical protein MN608_10293 [Microdochium nivale]
MFAQHRRLARERHLLTEVSNEVRHGDSGSRLGGAVLSAAWVGRQCQPLGVPRPLTLTTEGYMSSAASSSDVCASFVFISTKHLSGLISKTLANIATNNPGIP